MENTADTIVSSIDSALEGVEAGLASFKAFLDRPDPEPEKLFVNVLERVFPLTTEELEHVNRPFDYRSAWGFDPYSNFVEEGRTEGRSQTREGRRAAREAGYEVGRTTAPRPARSARRGGSQDRGSAATMRDRAIVRWMAEQGRWVTAQMVASQFELSIGQARHSLWRLEREGRITKPQRGFFVAGALGSHR